MGSFFEKFYARKTHPHGTQGTKRATICKTKFTCKQLLRNAFVMSSGPPRAKATCSCSLLGLPPSAHSPSSHMPLSCCTAQTAGIFMGTNLGVMVVTSHRVSAPAQASLQKIESPTSFKEAIDMDKGYFPVRAVRTCVNITPSIHWRFDSVGSEAPSDPQYLQSSPVERIFAWEYRIDTHHTWDHGS